MAAFAAAPEIGLIVIAAPPGAEEEVERTAGEATLLAAGDGPPTHVIVLTGGAARADSVGLGLAEVPASAEIVAVHDAARPLVSPELIGQLLARLAAEPGAAGVIAAVPITDTVKQVEGERIVATPPREGLWAAQTPQVFRAEALRRAHDARPAEAATDDAMLVEHQGGTMLVEQPRHPNLKVTTATDLRLAELLLAERRADFDR